MSTRRFLATALVSSLGCYGLAAPPAGAEPSSPAPGRSALRASVDRAVGTASLPRTKKADGIRLTTTGDGGGGGGGGHVVLMVVGLAASAAATYFVIKETKKQTGQTQ